MIIRALLYQAAEELLTKAIARLRAGRLREPVERRVLMRVYPVVSDAVELALELGWNRAHKYADDPEPAHIREEQHNAVMLQLCSVLDFDPEPDEDL